MTEVDAATVEPCELMIGVRFSINQRLRRRGEERGIQVGTDVIGDTDRFAVERESAFVEGLREERAVACKQDEGALALLPRNDRGTKPGRDEWAVAGRHRHSRGRVAVRRDEFTE